VRWCPWPLSPQVIAPCSTGYELLQLPRLRRSFAAPRSSPQARHSARGASGRSREGRPPQPGSVPHLPHGQPHHQQRKKQAGPARRECLHATGSGAGDITTTPASSPPGLVAAPAAILTERYRCLGCLADRGYSPQAVRAYASGLLAFARWLAAGRLALGEVSAGVVLRYLAYCRRRCCRVARAATCTRSGTAATPAMRLRRSAGGWPRCRACSAAGRCGTRLRPAPSRVAPRHAGQRPGSAAGCGPAWPGRRGALACGSASRGGCPAAWTAPRPPRCWRASAPIRKGVPGH